jgi:glycosyltransferase involved in cell wall biosynthesis
MIRVLQFADIINLHDFIDVIVRNADPSRFLIGACVRSSEANIADPGYSRANMPFWNLRAASRPALPLAVTRLVGVLREWKPDILHTHHYEQALIGWIATRFCRRTRLVIGRHYSDAIYRLPTGLHRKALLQLEDMSNRAAARIIAPSRTIFEILTQKQGIDAARIDVIPYAFDPAKYVAPTDDSLRHIREEFGLQGRFVAGTFARLHAEKGHSFLLEAAIRLKGQIPGLLFLLVGDGPERLALGRQLQENGLQDSVRLTGHRRDAMALMSAVDFVVQPTLQEAFSQVMVEAMWMGKPLIITNVSGAVDLVRDGENGMLIPAGNAEALTAAILRLSRSPELRKKLACNGREFVSRTLTPERILSLYEQSYLKTLAPDRG